MRGRFALTEKTERLQLRCTPMQRDAISARAIARHMSMAEYLLDLVRRDLLGLPEEG